MNAFEIEAKLKIDTKDYEKGLKDAESKGEDFADSLENIEDSASNLSDAMSSASDDMSDSFQDMSENASTAFEEISSNASESAEDVTSAYDDITVDIDTSQAESDLSDVSSEAQTSASETESAFSGLSLDFDTSGAESSIGNMSEDLSGMNSVIGMLPGGMSTAMSGMVSAITGGGIIAAIGGITSVIGDVMSSASEMADSWDDACDAIAISTGLTVDKVNDLSNAMSEAYYGTRNMGATEEEIGAIVGEITTKFGELDETKLTDLTTQVSDLAGAFNVDAIGMVDSLYTSTLRWGDSAGSTTDIIDKLVTASQNSGIGVDELSDAMNSNAAVFQSLGLSYDEGLNFLANYGKASGDVTSSVKALNTAYDNLSESPHGEYIFRSAIEQMNEYDNASEAMNECISTTGMTFADLFGDNKIGRSIVENLTTGTSSFEGMTDGWENSLETLMTDTTDFADRHEIAMRVIQESVAQSYEDAENYFYSWDAQLDELRTSSGEMAAQYDQAMSDMLASTSVTDEMKSAFDTYAEEVGSSTSGLLYYLQQGTEGSQTEIERMSAVTGQSVDDINAAIAVYKSSLSGQSDAAATAQKDVSTANKKQVDSTKDMATKTTNSASTAKSAISGMASSITISSGTSVNALNRIKDAANNAGDAVKKNNGLTLSIHGSVPIFSEKKVGNTTVPVYSGTQTYAKAMNNAALFSRATTFNTAIAGEAGNELLTGEQHLKATVQTAVASAMGNVMGSIYELLAKYLPTCADNKDVYLDGSKVTDTVSRNINRKLRNARA